MDVINEAMLWRVVTVWLWLLAGEAPAEVVEACSGRDSAARGGHLELLTEAPVQDAVEARGGGDRGPGGVEVHDVLVCDGWQRGALAGW
jgi:hypothetical protein